MKKLPPNGAPTSSMNASLVWRRPCPNESVAEVDVEILTVAVAPRMGGMTGWMDQIGRGLSGRGWRVRLIGISDEGIGEGERPFETVHVPMRPVGFIPFPLFDKWLRWSQARRAIRRLGLSAPRIRISDSTPGILDTVSRMRGRERTPWVVMAGGDVFKETSGAFLSGVLQRRVRRNLNQADLISVDGPDLREGFVRQGVREDLLSVSYHGVEIDLYPDRSQASQFFPPNEGDLGKMRLAWHGRFSNHHGADRFLDIAAKVKGCEPRMAGGPGAGGDSSRILEQVRSSGLWVGQLSERDLPRFLLEADCGAYPLENMAGVPRVLLESMGAGLATVTFPVGAVRELIEDGRTGFIVRDEGEMIDRVTWLRENPAERVRIGQAARDRIIKKWSSEATLDSFEGKLKSFLTQ